MSHGLTEPVHWQGRQWAVTGFGIEALDGMYHIPFADIPPGARGQPEWLDSLRRRYGTDCNDLDAALRVARTIQQDNAPQPPCIAEDPVPALALDQGEGGGGREDKSQR